MGSPQVRVSLAEPPTVDFRLQPLSGVDLAAVPGLRAWIQAAIQSALVDIVAPVLMLRASL